MKNISRRDALKLIGLTTAGGVLAACTTATPTAAPTAVPQPTTAPVTADTATTAPTAAPTDTPAPTATAAPTALPAYELRYIYAGGIPKDLTVVQDALSTLLKAKINATIKLEVVDWGSYTDKVNLMVSSGEVFDLLFVCPWLSPSYIQLVNNGGLAALDDLLPKYAPDLQAAVPALAWGATKVAGKMYGVPNQQIWVKPFGPSLRKDLYDKYKVDFSTINKLEDLEPFFAAVKAGEPGVFPCQGGSYIGEYFGWDPIVTQTSQVSVVYNDATMKTFNAYDTPQFKAQVDLMRKWYLAGYFPKDTIPSADVNNTWKAGKIASSLLGVVKPGGDMEASLNLGVTVTSKNLSPIFMSTASVTATMTAIGATSKDPARAAMFLNLVNTDKDIYNTLCKGVEGKHWVWVDQANNVIGPGPNAADYAPGTDWEFGSVFNAYYNSKGYADIKFNESTAALNNGAAASVALGFAFNPDPVKTELAQVEAVVTEIGNPLIAGMADPAASGTGYDAFIKKMTDAGMDKLVTEAQSQLNKWAGK
jgi:putative aldouronate transport system substrate-binding protein